ncbi:MAG TPA: flagellar assembly protein FliH [Bacillus sp. (in: firmicutes)]|uniref:flagellar assembly protein FliH n=1 Tax=Bacillus litorisediminis TaxID=2922713 RepID=UPI001FAB6D40|nr:flagellar assembly protein FliH [Bacillus litorisediminis]HWO77954.1 flagellar assembly protein FliH [Bacillus sp. (in: firmicutes)]
MSKILKRATPLSNLQQQKIIGVQSFYTQQIEQKIEEDPRKIAQKMIADAKLEADQIIQNAILQRETAQKELEQAKADWAVEREQLKSLAKTAGYEAGYQEGLNKGYEQVQTLIQQANSIVNQAKQDYHTHLVASERTIVELAVQIAEKIIGEQLNDDEAYISYIKQAIEQVKNQKTVYVYVHPDHYETLMQIKQELKLILPAEADIYIYANPELTSSGCYIETEGGKLDASVEVQLTQIKSHLLEWLEGDEH